MNDFDKLRQKLDKLLDGLLGSTEMKEIGEYAAGLIKERTRKGFGSDNGKSSRLQKLKPGYTKQRQKLKAKGQLSNETTPNKSNLTKTGEMLDNIQVTPGKNEVTLGFTGKNQQKAQYVTEKGRPFFGLSTKEQWKVNKVIKDAVKAAIKKQGL